MALLCRSALPASPSSRCDPICCNTTVSGAAFSLARMALGPEGGAQDTEGRVRVAAQAALKAMQTEKTASAELDRLRGELESLRKRNRDLADRLKKLEAKYGHTVEVDINTTYKGNDPKQLRNNLVSSIESNTLQEFTFRDDSGGTRNYYVDVTSATGIEYTGYDERGSSRITLVEP